MASFDEKLAAVKSAKQDLKKASVDLFNTMFDEGDEARFAQMSETHGDRMLWQAMAAAVDADIKKARMMAMVAVQGQDEIIMGEAMGALMNAFLKEQKASTIMFNLHGKFLKDIHDFELKQHMRAQQEDEDDEDPDSPLI